MLVEFASEKTLRTPSEAAAPAWSPPDRSRSKILAHLNRHECRYCVADTAEGQMHAALFCAAPADEGPYCPDHRQVCRLPAKDDAELLAAEIEAALNRPR